VGEAIRQSGIPREEVFVTTKMWNDEQGYEETLEAFHRSLRRLGTGYIDLYLVHWPMRESLETWKALERLYREGACRAIGVCNFTTRHMGELLRSAEIVPAVNQVELHPFFQRREIRCFCRERGIQVEAFSPLARGKRMDDPRLKDIASRKQRSPAQIMLRWSIEKGLVAIPKAAKKERIEENGRIFDFRLSAEDVAMLDALDEGYRTTRWDPEQLP